MCWPPGWPSLGAREEDFSPRWVAVEEEEGQCCSSQSYFFFPANFSKLGSQPGGDGSASRLLVKPLKRNKCIFPKTCLLLAGGLGCSSMGLLWAYDASSVGSAFICVCQYDEDAEELSNALRS